MGHVLLFFRHLIILLSASSLAVTISVTSILLYYGDFNFTQKGLVSYLRILGDVILGGHLFAFPFLFLAYFPLSLALWYKNTPFVLFPVIASILALVNGLFIMLVFGGAKVLWFVPLFVATGFFTGAIHYGLLKLDRKLEAYIAKKSSG